MLKFKCGSETRGNKTKEIYCSSLIIDVISLDLSLKPRSQVRTLIHQNWSIYCIWFAFVCILSEW